MLLGAPASGVGDGSYVVVTSRDAGPYAGVLSGVRGVLGKGDDVAVHSLESERDGAMEALRRARRRGKAPILTVGSVATRAALQLPGDAPVVACMILDPKDLEGRKHATGVLIEFPLETQLEWVRRFLPRSQSIGVLYNPAENSERIAEARKIAERLGMKLIAREVHSPKDLPGALESVAREADFLFALTDQTVLSRQTAQAILLFSFRNRMPFSGLSSSWVKAGALYALERDYQDLGAQCAEMALSVRRGKRVSSIEPEEPRKVVYTLNLRTADHLRLSLPPDLVDGAAEVFR
jgi:putative ABC transport system substrate-binding protein